MADLRQRPNVCVIGAVYLDLSVSIDARALISNVDVQLFAETQYALGGTGFNQARLISAECADGVNIRLVTTLGTDEISKIVMKMCETHRDQFETIFLLSELKLTPPVVNILNVESEIKTRRVMIGPQRRYISKIWEILRINLHLFEADGDAGLVFDGYSLTGFGKEDEEVLSAICDRYSSRTLLLLPHRLYEYISKETFLLALSYFTDLESSFYTVSRLLFGIGEQSDPPDDLIARTVLALRERAPHCELHLRFGDKDAQHCIHVMRQSQSVTINTYDIDDLGQKSVGDKIQVYEMFSSQKLRLLRSRTITLNNRYV